MTVQWHRFRLIVYREFRWRGVRLRNDDGKQPLFVSNINRYGQESSLKGVFPDFSSLRKSDRIYLKVIETIKSWKWICYGNGGGDDSLCVCGDSSNITTIFVQKSQTNQETTKGQKYIMNMRSTWALVFEAIISNFIAISIKLASVNKIIWWSLDKC